MGTLLPCNISCGPGRTQSREGTKQCPPSLLGKWLLQTWNVCPMVMLEFQTSLNFFLLLILFFIVCGCVHVSVGARGARGIRSPRSPELELQAGVSLGTGYRYWVLGTGNGAQVLCNSNSRLSSPESQTSSLTWTVVIWCINLSRKALLGNSSRKT